MLRSERELMGFIEATLPPSCVDGGGDGMRDTERHDETLGRGVNLNGEGVEDVGRRLRKGHALQHEAAISIGRTQGSRHHGGAPPIERV